MDTSKVGTHETFPWREWYNFRAVTLEHHAESMVFCNLPAEYQNASHLGYGRCGQSKDGGGTYTSWLALFIPSDDDFALVAGMDEAMVAGFYYYFANEDFSVDTETHFHPSLHVMNDPQGVTLDWNAVSTWYYDGVNTWPSRPITFSGATIANPQKVSDFSVMGQTPGTSDNNLPLGADPTALMNWGFNWNTWGGIDFNDKQDEFFAFGFCLEVNNYYDPPNWQVLDNGESAQFQATPYKVKVYYFNPVVNAISPTSIDEGGEDLTITGLNFDPPELDLDDYAWNTTNVWDDRVQQIVFEGRQGQGNYTVNEAQFTTHANTEIVIPASELSTLPRGTYNIRLYKTNNDLGADYVNVYAGEWRTDSSARARPGTRIILNVGEESKRKGTPVILTEWGFYNANDFIDAWYAKIDVRGSSVFYDGRILTLGTLSRGFEDEFGLLSISDITMSLANTDKDFSIKRYSHMVKNQLMGIYSVYDDQPLDLKESIITVVCDDDWIHGPVFHASFYDLTRKYFTRPVPDELATEAEFPHIHDSAKNRGFPIALGLNYLVGETPGAIEALYIDTRAGNWKYLALGGSGKSITQVYSDGNEKVEGAGNDYTISYEDGGRTYINFNADQEEAKITFNCEGYIFGDWNSTKGYVQNPAYILLFYFAFLMQMPMEYIDVESFNVLAVQFEDEGYEEAGRLVVQDERSGDEILREFLFTFGVRMWPDSYGRVKVERKEYCDLSSTLHIWEQIDCIGHAVRKFNTDKAINFIKAKYDFYPTVNYFKGSDEASDPLSIADFGGKPLEPSADYLFPWTNSADLIADRLAEILAQFAYGDQKIHFDLPINFIDKIDVNMNFTFQNPYGLDASGHGERARLYFFEKITVDFDGNLIQCVGSDLQWLLGQCFILGDRSTLPNLYSDASNEQRLYGYLCDRTTGRFLTGHPGKKLCSRK